MNLATRLEIIFLIASYIAGIVGVGFAARLILEAIGPHPVVAEATLPRRFREILSR